MSRSSGSTARHARHDERDSHNATCVSFRDATSGIWASSLACRAAGGLLLRLMLMTQLGYSNCIEFRSCLYRTIAAGYISKSTAEITKSKLTLAEKTISIFRIDFVWATDFDFNVNFAI